MLEYCDLQDIDININIVVKRVILVCIGWKVLKIDIA